jgi:hypothetical protein
MKPFFTQSVIPGTSAVFAVLPEWAAPIGYLYYRIVMGNYIEILHCYVHPTMRRRGYLTKMFLALRGGYPDSTFITQQGTEQSEPWLRKMSFEQRTDGWWLPPIVRPEKELPLDNYEI